MLHPLMPVHDARDRLADLLKTDLAVAEGLDRHFIRFQAEDGMKRRDSEVVGILKAPTGVVGLDEVTDGGLPAGRPTLVCGGAGSGISS